MKPKQTPGPLEKENYTSTFFFGYALLLKSIKSWLQKYKISKKLESLPKKEMFRLQRLYKQFFQKHLNCLYVKEFHEINMTWYSYIGIKTWRVLFHLQLLRLLMIRKVISNVFLSFYLMSCKIFFLINKSFFGYHQ